MWLFYIFTGRWDLQEHLFSAVEILFLIHTDFIFLLKLNIQYRIEFPYIFHKSPVSELLIFNFKYYSTCVIILIVHIFILYKCIQMLDITTFSNNLLSNDVDSFVIKRIIIEDINFMRFINSKICLHLFHKKIL